MLPHEVQHKIHIGELVHVIAEHAEVVQSWGFEVHYHDHYCPPSGGVILIPFEAYKLLVTMWHCRE